MKKTILYLIFALIAALMLLLLPANMLASGIFGAQNEPTRVKQLDELRESNSDTYLLSDGSYECVVYADDKYYKDDSGKYVEIDHSIIKAQNTRSGRSYAYKNSAGDASAYFAENEPRVCVEMNGSSLSFSLSGANRTSARAGEASAKRSVHEYELFGKNYISYENVLNGTDLIYEMLNGCLKEYVLLKDSSAPSEYTFIFDAPELRAQKTENGTVEFINAADEPVFELGALFAVDSNGEYTDALEYTVRETGQKGRYEITVSVSKDYLNAPERAFPVLVDPSVNIYGSSLTYDSFVSNKYKDKNYYLDDYLYTGNTPRYGICRTYINFKLPESVMGCSISEAYIRLKMQSGITPNAYLYRVTQSWSSSGIKWENKPNYTTDKYSRFYLNTNNWYKSTITAIVQDWADEVYPNYGVVVKEGIEGSASGGTAFYSSDAPAPNRPELHIIYSADAVIQQDRHYSTYASTAAYRDNLQELMNCYGYAIHVYSENKAYEYKQTWSEDYVLEYNYVVEPYEQQPGEFAHTIDYVKAKHDEAFSKTNGNDALNIIQTLIYADFKALSQSTGSEWTIKDTTASAVVPSGWRKIALVIKLSGNKDFHFYMRHSDGTWSHKRGSSPVKDTSIESDVLLNDGNINTAAREGGYSDGIRYYLIRKSAVIDYCHKAGHYGDSDNRRPSSTPLQTSPAFTDRAGAEPKTSQTISGTLTGARFDYSSDIDYYAFTPTQSGTYTIKTSITSSAYDVDIEMFNNRGVRVAAATDLGNAILSVNLVAGRTYYIRVSDFNNNKGTYTLYINK